MHWAGISFFPSYTARNELFEFDLKSGLIHERAGARVSESGVTTFDHHEEIINIKKGEGKREDGGQHQVAA